MVLTKSSSVEDSTNYFPIPNSTLYYGNEQDYPQISDIFDVDFLLPLIGFYAMFNLISRFISRFAWQDKTPFK